MIYGSRDNNFQDGFTLVEVMVSIIVFAIMMVALAQIYATGTLHVVKQGDRRKATSLAQESLEIYSATNFAAVAAKIATSPNDEPTNYGDFSRSASFDYVNDGDFSIVSGPATNSIRITVTVSTTRGTKGFHDIVLEHVITDWQ